MFSSHKFGFILCFFVFSLKFFNGPNLFLVTRWQHLHSVFLSFAQPNQGKSPPAVLQKMLLCNNWSRSSEFLVIFLYTSTISSPMQFPRASWMKPAPHLTFGRQRNDPCVFWHSNSCTQLWIPVSHSSISG